MNIGPNGEVITFNPCLYVIVRTDMPSMNNGKAQAHSGHAVSAFEEAAIIQPLENGQKPNELVQLWRKMTKQGFGTQINLKVPWNDVKRIVSIIYNDILVHGDLSSSPLMAELVTDPTYPYLVPNKEILDLIDPKLHTMDPYCLADGQYLWPYPLHP